MKNVYINCGIFTIMTYVSSGIWIFCKQSYYSVCIINWHSSFVIPEEIKKCIYDFLDFNGTY